MTDSIKIGTQRVGYFDTLHRLVLARRRQLANEGGAAIDSLPVAVLPEFDSYFVSADTPGAPAAPAGALGSVAFRTLILAWTLPAEAAWRTWEVYEGTTTGFTPDTTTFANRVAVLNVCGLNVTHDPGATTYYYKICAVNTSDTRSTFTALGPYTFSAIPTNDIAALAVTNAKIAVDAIQGAVIAAGAITNAKIGVDAIQGTVIAAGAITETKIGTDAISTRTIAALAVTAAEIAANTITAAKIAAGAITTTEIAAGTIVASDMAAGTITANEIAANTITAAKMVAGTITATEIAASTITAAKMVAGTITAASGIIADACITNAQIADATISSAKIASLDCAKINAGTINAALTINSPLITGGIFRTAASGTCIELSGTLEGTLNFFHVSYSETLAIGSIVSNSTGLSMSSVAGKYLSLSGPEGINCYGKILANNGGEFTHGLSSQAGTAGEEFYLIDANLNRLGLRVSIGVFQKNYNGGTWTAV